MKRVFITGAGGFVGANLTRRLVEAGHEVHLLLLPAGRYWRLDDIFADVRVHYADLNDGPRIRSTLGAVRPEWIFHLAAYGAYSYQTDAQRILQSNVLGLANLIEAGLATGFEAFVNTGTSSEYGLKQHAPNEDERLEPNSVYAVSKAAATQLCRFTAARHGVYMPTLRLYSVYGSYEEPTRLMPSLLVHALRGSLPPLVDPGIARDYVFIDDVVNAYLTAAATPSDDQGVIYNIGTGEQTTLGEVVEHVVRALHVAVQPRWGSMPNRSWDTTCWIADPSRFKAASGWQPAVSLAEGLEMMAAWLVANPALLDYYQQRLGIAS